MNRKIVPASIGVFCVLASCPSIASAQDSNSVSIEIRAVVQPFCRIQSEMGDRPGFLVNGTVELGAVRELCNTPGGYNVNVQLTNVSSGVLTYGSEIKTLDAEGSASIRWGMPRSRIASWKLTEASLRQTGLPVYLRVSISPV